MSRFIGLFYRVESRAGPYHSKLGYDRMVVVSDLWASQPAIRGFFCQVMSSSRASNAQENCCLCSICCRFAIESYILGSLIWSRDIICLHILLQRKKFLCGKICKQIMSLDQMRDPIVCYLACIRKFQVFNHFYSQEQFCHPLIMLLDHCAVT